MTITVARDSKFGKLLERAQQDEDAEAARPTYEQLVAEIAAARAALNALGIGAPGTSEPPLAAGIELLASALGAAQETAEKASEEARRLRKTLDEKQIVIGGATGAIAELRGDFDCLLEAIEATSPKKAAAIFASAELVETTRRSLIAEVVNLRESLAARDQAVRDAAATVAEIRSERDFAVGCAMKEKDDAIDAAKRAVDGFYAQAAETEAGLVKQLDDARTALADYVERESVALMDLVGVMKERDEARAHLAAMVAREEPQRLQYAAAILDSERTLEAVRAELLRTTAERDEAKRRYDRAIEVSVKHLSARTGLISSLRRRLSEVSRDKDPQRNVTAGLLRVEQAAMQYLVQRCGEFMDERDKARRDLGEVYAPFIADPLPDAQAAPRDWHVPAPHVPVALAANEDAEWSLAPEEIDP